MGLFIGPWTDTAGRKPALLLAALGATIEAIMVIGVMVNHWSLYLLLVGKFFNAMTGFFSGMAQTSFAYVFDTTDHTLISTRLGEWFGKEWINERTSERANERTNERTNE